MLWLSMNLECVSDAGETYYILKPMDQETCEAYVEYPAVYPCYVYPKGLNEPGHFNMTCLLQNQVYLSIS